MCRRDSPCTGRRLSVFPQHPDAVLLRHGIAAVSYTHLRTEWANYLSWAQDFAYDKLGLPRPDLVLFLDMPVEVSQALLLGRYHGDEEKKDINESDLAFLRDCAQTARFAAQRLHWHVIPCSENGVPLEREKIHQSVLSELEELL